MEFNRRKNVEQDQRLSTLGTQVNTILTQTPSGFLPKVYYGLTRGTDTYRFTQDATYNIVGLGGSVGDAYELYSTTDSEYIPAIAIQSDSEEITIFIPGDYNLNVNTFDLVNMVSGASLSITLVSPLSLQAASFLGDYSAQDNKGKQITAIRNLETNEYNVVFGSVDFNNDETYNWIRLGSYTNGTNGTAIWSVNTSNISTILGVAKVNDSLVALEDFTEGSITFSIGDIWEITSFTPDLTGTLIGNIRGAQGPAGLQGATGSTGAPGDTPQIISGNWWISGVDTGVQAVGQNGTNGVNGQSFIMNSGLYSTDDNYGESNNVGPNGEVLLQLPTLPQASGMTGYAYLVYDPLTTPLEPFYDLYYANDNDNDWTIMHPFSGIKGANGVNGYTPYIYNNTWYINGVSTGVTATGPQGPQGAVGASPQGNWVVNNSYSINDIVTYGGSSYICINNHSGVSITPDVDTTDWLLFVSKGDTGNTGLAAGFGAITATVDNNTGTPSVVVTTSGPNTAKSFTLNFSNLKGDKGDTGDTGPQGPEGPQGLGGAGSNPNLLINGDFRVNQRGQNVYALTGIPAYTRVYTVDRWKFVPQVSNSSSTITVNSNSISVYCANTYDNISQNIENFSDFAGKTLTLSIKVKAVDTTNFVIRFNIDGTQYSYKGISSTGITTLTSTLPNTINSSLQASIVLAAGSAKTIEIEYIKLEVGEVATPFSPRPYAEELAMCQRYFLKLSSSGSGNRVIGTTFAFSGSNVGAFIPCNLRTSPTLTFEDIQIRSGSLNGVTVETATLDGWSSNFVQINCTTSGATAGESGLLRTRYSTSYVALDAEIY